jgi:hypothetical protein
MIIAMIDISATHSWAAEIAAGNPALRFMRPTERLQQTPPTQLVVFHVIKRTYLSGRGGEPYTDGSKRILAPVGVTPLRLSDPLRRHKIQRVGLQRARVPARARLICRIKLRERVQSQRLVRVVAVQASTRPSGAATSLVIGQQRRMRAHHTQRQRLPPVALAPRHTDLAALGKKIALFLQKRDHVRLKVSVATSEGSPHHGGADVLTSLLRLDRPLRLLS